ncbi:hypothetical protein ABTO88_19525, partial [Acinetobacter baumannii]
ALLLIEVDEVLLVYFNKSRLKSCVPVGGIKPLKWRRGAPHKPGTKYVAKEKLAMANNNLGTDT